MPHLVILYSGNLEHEARMSKLCRTLADTMLAQRDEAGKAVFPPGGTRVLAFASSHHAISDGGARGIAAGGDGDYGFVYLNLRMAAGRTQAVIDAVGAALDADVKEHFASLLERRHLGITLQIDVSPGQAFDAKTSSLHPLFAAIGGASPAAPT